MYNYRRSPGFYTERIIEGDHQEHEEGGGVFLGSNKGRKELFVVESSM